MIVGLLVSPRCLMCPRRMLCDKEALLLLPFVSTIDAFPITTPSCLLDTLVTRVALSKEPSVTLGAFAFLAIAFATLASFALGLAGPVTCRCLSSQHWPPMLMGIGAAPGPALRTCGRSALPQTGGS